MIERTDRVDAMLPPPELLLRYKEMGLGDNLVELIKEEQEHRHILQKKYLLSYRFGQVSSLIITIFFLQNIFSLITKGLDKQAFIITAIFASLVLFAILMLRRNKNIVNKKRFARGMNQNNNKFNNFPKRNNNYRK